ncbi:hypothetical protein M422DRAFT_58957 [Sphaerobolus stellatus SS14]|nr:hypothetical protein M422DRAFT_58957 [Sphaerobolus stellatus SS14]
MEANPADFKAEGRTHLTWLSIVLAFTFIAINAGLSYLFELDIGTSLVIGAIRCVVQLSSVFETNNPWAVAGIAFLLNILGAFETVVNRSPRRYAHMFPTVLIAMLTSTIPISLFTTRFIMAVDPFWKPDQYIPIVGMLAGSTVAAIVVALSLITREINENRDKIEMHLAFGASRREACRPLMQQALKLALMPSINQMSVIGMIAIPGMMTGALLGGSSVEQAAKLQTDTALGAMIAIILCLGIIVDSDHRIRNERVDTNKHVVWQMRDKVMKNAGEMAAYGRRRESIVDIEEQISDIFTNHPEAHFNEADTPVIPAHALPDVIAELSSRYNVEVLNKDEEQQVAAFVRDNPGIEVTPELLLGFVAAATAKHNDSSSGASSPEPNESDNSRGRGDEKRNRPSPITSRSSSRGDDSTNWKADNKSSGAWGVPNSPFESKSRQRSQPLYGPPSSWTPRPAPAHHRRRSDAGSRRGSMSDNESPSNPRTRVPSTPSSPTYSPEAKSPSLPGRPHSRSHSHSNFSIEYGLRQFDFSFDNTTPSPDREDRYTTRSPSHMDDMVETISSLPMPNSHDSDSDEDNDDPTHRIGLVMDYERSIASSIASLGPHERLEALQKNNHELARRAMEAEKNLQNRLADHEMEIEDLQSKLDELKSELTATKREEKELRNKERQNIQQIQLLESELAKLQKALDSSKGLYQNLNKQYVEQCSESEKLRNALRQKDLDIKNLEDLGHMQQLELIKWGQQREAMEAAHTLMEQDLVIARHAQSELDDQKQENLVLKETIDRLRFDLDELRTREHAVAGGPSSSSSQFGSVSKSLGQELLNKWEAMQDDDAEDTEEDTEEEETSDTDGEEMIQTIITRKKRKIGTGKKQVVEITETKEYADAYTQHEVSEFVRAAATQTDPEFKPVRYTSSVQTEPEPTRALRSLDTQTEPEKKRVLSSMEIQTEPEAAITQEDDEELASSSSTLRPPIATPKAIPEPSIPTDAPPSYDQVLSREVLTRLLRSHEHDHDNMRIELKIAEATLKQWHKGVNMPFEPIPDGVSVELLEQWTKIKKELGAECMVIDKILDASKKVGKPAAEKPKRPRHRFYNIYNTYFYNKSDSPLTSIATPLVVGFVFSSVMFMALSPTPYAVPGMPTYQDRAYWTAFNTLDAMGEGFGGGGRGEAVWSVLGRVLLGSAEVVRRVNMPS